MPPSDPLSASPRPDPDLASDLPPFDASEGAASRLLAALAEEPLGEACLEALEALAPHADPRAVPAVREAARSPSGPLRLASVAWLARRPEEASFLAERLGLDPAPEVRRALVRALASMGPHAAPSLLAALTDPVWRVRRDAVRALASMAAPSPSLQDQITRDILAARPVPWAALGALHALEDGWGRPRSVAEDRAAPPDRAPLSALPFWDDDPPVLARRMELARDEELLAHRELLPWLFTLQGSRPDDDFLEDVRCRVADVLLRLGETADDLRVASLLDEPRHPFAPAAAARYLEALPPARAEALARGRGSAAPAAPRAPPEGPRGAARSPDPPAYFAPRRPPPPRWRGNPQLARPSAEVPRRQLGRGGPWVSALGVSGRYGLPSRGYEEALAAGVNLFFWEPEYGALTSFICGLGPEARAGLVMAAGSFEATARGIRRDAERALRTLRLERLSVFVLFWVRSRGRLSEEVTVTLAALAEEGKIGLPGFSSHDRAIAVHGLSLGLPVVMVRHSAAHPGAERAVLPEAARRGVGVLGFSALCYGRLLAAPGREGASARDCYRYSLAQPGMSACLSAPRTLGELRENTQALAAPPLTPGELARLRRVGERVHAENTAFADLLRSR